MKLTTLGHDSLDDTQRRLRAEGTPYALATVVRTWAATSAKPGSKAVVSAEGEILEGWVGGGCARGAIGRAARKAIERNEPVLVALRPDDRLAAEGVEPCEVRDGMIYERNGCASKGSLDIYVEPFVPSPDLVVLGDGPVARALATLARGFDFRVGTDLPARPLRRGGDPRERRRRRTRTRARLGRALHSLRRKRPQGRDAE
jgi:xanthine dehydrogenase accessory factor